MVPFFTLDRYGRRRAAHASTLHLLALVCECLHLDEPTVCAKHAIEVLKTANEASEDPILERRYAVAQAILERLFLSQRDYSGAHETFQTAFGPVPPEERETTIPWSGRYALCRLGLSMKKVPTSAFGGSIEQAEAAQHR